MLDNFRSNYNAYRFVYLIDVIGLIFTLIALAGFFLPDIFPYESLKGFSQNFGVEMMGTWLSVRLIDFLIQQREKADSIRTKALRNFRFWTNALHPLLALAYYRELQRLEREYRYTKGMAVTWRKYLSNSENLMFENLLLYIDESLTFAKDLEKVQRAFGAFYQSTKFRIDKIHLKNNTDPATLHINNEKQHEMQNSLQRLLYLSECYIHNYENVKNESNKLIEELLSDMTIASINNEQDKIPALFEEILFNKEKLELKYRHSSR